MINVLYLAGNIFHALALGYFFENDLKRKYNKNITAAILILMCIFSDFILDRYLGAVKTVIYEVIVFGSIYFLYSDKIKKKIIVLLMSTFFSVISEALVAFVLNLFVKSKDKYYIMGYVLSKLVFLFIIRLVCLKKQYISDYAIGNKIFISIVSIPMLSFAIFVLYDRLRNVSVFSTNDAIFYILILVINYINVIQYENVQEMLRLQKNNELLKEQKKSYLYQYEQNQKNVESIKKIKHNIKNDYISEMIMLENKEYDKLQALYKQKVDSVENISSISNSGNNVFDTIINYKLSEIKRDNIKFDTNIAIPKELGIKDEDIILVLGNLLDNVSEALAKCKVENRYAKLNVLHDKGMLYIETCNTYNKVKKDKDGNIISSKKDADWHGIGLKAIEDIVKKYNGDMVITDDDNYFTVKIIMEV